MLEHRNSAQLGLFLHWFSTIYKIGDAWSKTVHFVIVEWKKKKTSVIQLYASPLGGNNHECIWPWDHFKNKNGKKKDLHSRNTFYCILINSFCIVLDLFLFCCLFIDVAMYFLFQICCLWTALMVYIYANSCEFWFFFFLCHYIFFSCLNKAFIHYTNLSSTCVSIYVSPLIQPTDWVVDLSPWKPHTQKKHTVNYKRCR